MTELTEAAVLKDQARTALGIANSPCRHLECCVSWTDDNGRRWAGRGVVADGEERDRENIGLPVANTLQKRIEAAVTLCRKQNRPARIIVLKGRRSGSSVICAKIVDLECKHRQTKALVMADVFKRSDEIFQFVADFAESDVFPWGRGQPAVSARKIVYGNESEAIKETALDPNAGRGGGFRVLWFSEVAHYPTDGVRDATLLMMSSLNTVPQTPESLVIAESTANGQSGWFYETWQSAHWPEDDDYWKQWEQSANNKTDDVLWLRVFAGWHEIPRNALAVTEDQRTLIMGRLDRAETEGVRRYQWTAEQILWRRRTIASNFKGSAKAFDQEFPSDPQTAFATSGAPAFTRDSLRILRTMAERAQWQYGVLEPIGATGEDVLAGRMGNTEIIFRKTPEEEGWVAILEMPEDGHEYIGVCDPATGALLSEEEGAETDTTSVLVLRSGYTHREPSGEILTYRPRLVARLMWQVMEWKPQEKQTLYMLAMLMRFYGNCTLVIETNKGEWVIIGAKEAGLSLYIETILSRVEMTTTKKIGFTTTVESRHSIVTRLQSLVHGAERAKGKEMVWEPALEVECLHAVGEMDTFVRDKKGGFAAASGRHDDDVLALAMGTYFIDGASKFRVRVRERSRRQRY